MYGSAKELDPEKYNVSPMNLKIKHLSSKLPLSGFFIEEPPIPTPQEPKLGFKPTCNYIPITSFLPFRFPPISLYEPYVSVETEEGFGISNALSPGMIALGILGFSVLGGVIAWSGRKAWFRNRRHGR